MRVVRKMQGSAAMLSLAWALAGSAQAQTLVGAAGGALMVADAAHNSGDGDGHDGEHDHDDDRKPAKDIVVAGSRLSDSLKTFPGSVSVIGQKDLATHLQSTNDIASILAIEVPGLAPASSGTSSNVDQSLRGRVPRVFIDGIEVSSPLRDGGRDIRTVSPQSIARIEVIRGASSLYGEGGGGGVINYITRTGHPGEPWHFSTEIGAGFSTDHFAGSLQPSVFQSAQGSIGNFDIDVNGFYQHIDGLFDAHGKRLQPDPLLAGGDAYSDTYNLFGKIGYTFGRQRIEAMVNYYDQIQSTDYQNIAGNMMTGVPTSTVTGVVPARQRDPVNRTLVSYLAYTNSDILGSTLRAQFYYNNDFNVFAYNATRLGGTYTTIASRKYGFRSDVKTPFEVFDQPATLLWGADVSRDKTSQPLVPVPSLNQQFGAPLEQTNYAFFGQLDYTPAPWVTLHGGIRHDEFSVDVQPFVSGVTSARIGGGTLKYHATPVNAGVTFQPTPSLQVYGSYAQGFSIPDLGLALRGIAKPADNSVVPLNFYQPQAIVVTNYEVGLKYKHGPFAATLAVFQSTSPSGTDFQTIVVGAGTPTDAYRNEVILLRGKERIRGIEASANIVITKSTRVGASYALSEGQRDSNGNGRIDSADAYLSGRRIAPSSVVVYGDQDITAHWSLHVQAQRTGNRDRFQTVAPGSTFYLGRVRQTFLADLSTRYTFGMYAATIGVSNLFDKYYFPVSAQEYNQNNTYTPGEGRKVFIKLSANY